MNQNRYSFASHDYNLPSRFISELPEDIVEINDSTYIKENNFLQDYIETDNFNTDSITPGRKRLLDNSKKNEIDWDINQDYNFLNEINIGEKVYHKKFGYGKILRLDSDKALVDFEEHSSKNIYIKYLKIID